MYRRPDQPRPHRAVRPSPIFLAFVAVTVRRRRAGVERLELGHRSPSSASSCSSFGGWIVSVCLHEFAHAYTAYRAGDHSVEAAGYLTLNPFKYAHPLLSIVLPLLLHRPGRHRPARRRGVPAPAHVPHPVRSAASPSAVGPLTNVVFALIAAATRRRARQISGRHRARRSTGASGPALAFLGFLQVSAAILNLLPIPGLDGYGIIEPYLAPRPRGRSSRSSRGACSGCSCCCTRSRRSTSASSSAISWRATTRSAATRRLAARLPAVPVLAPIG